MADPAWPVAAPPDYDPEPWCAREGGPLVGLREAAALLGMPPRAAIDLLDAAGVRRRWKSTQQPYYARRAVLALAGELRKERSAHGEDR